MELLHRPFYIKTRGHNMAKKKKKLNTESCVQNLSVYFLSGGVKPGMLSSG